MIIIVNIIKKENKELTFLLSVTPEERARYKEKKELERRLIEIDVYESLFRKLGASEDITDLNNREKEEIRSKLSSL